MISHLMTEAYKNPGIARTPPLGVLSMIASDEISAVISAQNKRLASNCSTNVKLAATVHYNNNENQVAMADDMHYAFNLFFEQEEKLIRETSPFIYSMLSGSQLSAREFEFLDGFPNKKVLH